MSNMSHCRFRNTTKDLQDCIDEVAEQIESPEACSNLSAEESEAAALLAKQCVKLLAMLQASIGQDDFDLAGEHAERKAGVLMIRALIEAQRERARGPQ